MLWFIRGLHADDFLARCGDFLTLSNYYRQASPAPNLYAMLR